MRRRAKYVTAISVIVIIGLLSSCVKVKKHEPSQKPTHKFDSAYVITCEDVQENLERCENQEVICYGNGGIGIQCKFK